MKIELFYSTGCAQCAAAQAFLKSAAEQTVAGVDWREINVLDHLDYAVELGVLSLPAIAIDGELVFPALPNAWQLRDALLRRTTQGG